MPRTVSLAFPEGRRDIEVHAVVGRWAVHREPTVDNRYGKRMWVISEVRSGLKLPWCYLTRKEVDEAAKQLDLVCPDWMDRERWQSGEDVLEEWKAVGERDTVMAILRVVARPASKGFIGWPQEIEKLTEIVEGVRACPAGFCVEGIRRHLTEPG